MLTSHSFFLVGYKNNILTHSLSQPGSGGDGGGPQMEASCAHCPPLTTQNSQSMSESPPPTPRWPRPPWGQATPIPSTGDG